MPKTFDQLARAGLIDTARGIFRGKFGSGPFPQTGKEFADVIARIRSRGAEPGDIDYETARSIARRAITSLQGASLLEGKGDRLRHNQHGLDPSFRHLTDARYLYRAIIICKNEETGDEFRQPVDIESDEALTRDQIHEQALDGYSRGKATLTSSKSDYPNEGDCYAVEIAIAFAIRTR